MFISNYDIVIRVACLVLDVHVEVALHGPHVLVVVARGRQDLEADVAQCVQDHHGAENGWGIMLQTLYESLLNVHVIVIFHFEPLIKEAKSGSDIEGCV